MAVPARPDRRRGQAMDRDARCGTDALGAHSDRHRTGNIGSNNVDTRMHRAPSPRRSSVIDSRSRRRRFENGRRVGEVGVARLG